MKLSPVWVFIDSNDLTIIAIALSEGQKQKLETTLSAFTCHLFYAEG